MPELSYLALRSNPYEHDGYCLRPIRYEDREPIRQWRNAQLQVLRQAVPLTVEQQDAYFQRVVLPLFEQERPGQLLFSLLHHNELVAYGGLVHISWPDERAEISFLAAPARVRNPATYRQDFLTFLQLLYRVAFEDLRLNRLVTETYDLRPAHVAIMEESGLKPEGRLRQHVQLAPGTFADSLMHGLLAADYAATAP
ncbi:GNAT family N-acetyltransferase [Hymenobacter monticola]|uniref:GNAT family N-acetyltransferase n=1 Tax=Hymenobacter monticola TaxID=1705399 RepID=A0ABY4B2Q4_9BACT|nr:GNAT family N-acetyltransferase [Hymenobacter monticola]UOE33428.1 GNAT family N-acetyltransferase [Hymenobacter monticola]